MAENYRVNYFENTLTKSEGFAEVSVWSGWMEEDSGLCVICSSLLLMTTDYFMGQPKMTQPFSALIIYIYLIHSLICKTEHLFKHLKHFAIGTKWWKQVRHRNQFSKDCCHSGYFCFSFVVCARLSWWVLIFRAFLVTAIFCLVLFYLDIVMLCLFFHLSFNNSLLDIFFTSVLLTDICGVGFVLCFQFSEARRTGDAGAW